MDSVMEEESEDDIIRRFAVIQQIRWVPTTTRHLTASLKSMIRMLNNMRVNEVSLNVFLCN